MKTSIARIAFAATTALTLGTPALAQVRGLRARFRFGGEAD